MVLSKVMYPLLAELASSTKLERANAQKSAKRNAKHNMMKVMFSGCYEMTSNPRKGVPSAHAPSNPRKGAKLLATVAMTQHPSNPRKGAKHLMVLALLAMCFSAVASMKELAPGEQPGPKYSPYHAGRDVLEHPPSDREAEASAPPPEKPTPGRRRQESRISMEQNNVEDGPKLEKAQKCRRCSHVFTQEFIKKACVKNYLARKREEDKNNSAPEGYISKKLRDNTPFKYNNELRELAKGYQREHDQNPGEDTDLKQESLTDEAERTCFDPKTQKGYRGFDFDISFWNWRYGFLFKRHENRTELIQCPTCKMVMEVIIDNDEYTVRKKVLDRNWKGGVIVSTICMGIGFVNYMIGLRSEQSVSDQYFGHAMFIMGAFFLLYFLLRGNGFFDGNRAMLFFKLIGLTSGMASAASLVAALSNVTTVKDGADLKMSEIYENSETSFKLMIAFAAIALILIIGINVHHNKNVPNDHWYSSSFFKGVVNLGLLASIGVGTTIMGDIFIRITKSGDQNMEVGAGSFIAAGCCLTYLMVYILVRTIWKKDAHWGYKCMTIVAATGFTASVFGLIDGVQDGASVETFGQTACAAVGIGIFLLIGWVMVMKIYGRKVCSFGEDD